MKLTKQLEAEVLNVYEAYWGGLLNVDMETYAAVLDKDFKLIGTTEAEVFFKKMEAVRFLKATADQVAGNIELRNRIIKVEPVDTLILITEQCDVYVNIDNVWTFYAKTRMSSLLQKKDNDWKFVQMHLSHPDMQAEEGQTIGLEKISRENLELREAVKRRTIELESKNRELEIESSLERVRAVAMGMKQPDDLLEVAKTKYNELKQLGFTHIRNALIGIFNDEKKYFTDYDYSDFSKGSITPIPYNKNKVIDRSLKQMKSATDAFTEFIVKGKELEEWKAFRKQNGEYDDSRIGNALYYYFYSINSGNIGLSTFKRINKEQVEILKRFRNVFDLAYKRYIDITNAEAQAREAEIELALERVRARTMAMQNSNELPEAANLLFQQVQALGMPAWSAGYCIWNEDLPTGQAGKSAVTLWMSSEGVLQPSFTAPTTEDELFIQMRKGYEEGKTFHVVEMGGKKLVKHYQYMRTLPVVGEILDSITTAGHPLPTFQIMHHAYFSKGFLLFITYQPVPEAHDIFKRFAKVFDQTYTRFLDLQKAEAQTKESQIQLALERVRARTMAMQKSEELQDAANLLFKQVQSLGIPAWSCGYNIWETGDKVCIGWMSSEGMLQPAFKIPLTESPTFIRFLKSKEKDEIFYVEEVGGKDLSVHYEYMLSLPDFAAIAEKHIKEGYPLPSFQINHVVNFKHGNLIFITSVPAPEAHDIFKRFAAVFEQTYTRFLDLQKAEAQARESQIELGLERVRAKGMAMQNSDQLAELVDTVLAELTKLDFSLTRCLIWLIDEDTLSARVWMANPEINKAAQYYHLQYFDHPYYKSVIKSWKERNQKFVYELKGKEKQVLDNIIFNKPELRHVPDAVKAAMMAVERAVLSFSFNNFGGLQADGLEQLSDANLDILSRFSKVFDQTYTRFNDLKQAEAQAKESQIQLAMERVRARTMAMQKSDELNEVAGLLFKQVSDLGIRAWTTGFNVWSDDNNFYTDYITSPQGNLIKAYTIDATKFSVFSELSDAKKRGENFWVQYLEGDLLKDAYKELSSFGDEKQYERMLADGFEFPSHQYDHFVFGSKVSLMFITYESVPEAHDVFKRFGKVFEQTYTRFLDLQKAEAQAREAHIEAALEKVRSRSLAMHKSEELKEVIQVVYEQFIHLNINIEHTGFIIDYKQRDDMHIWLADQYSSPFEITIPYFDSPHWNSFIRAKKNGENFFANLLTFEVKNKFYQDLFKLIPPLPEEAQQAIFSKPGLAISTVLLDNAGLYIENFSGTPFTDDDNTTLMRFGKVFQQTYTRFLDLQKAEAQAREAKIEAALEKVRSRSLAMHKSEEIKEVVKTVVERIKELDIEMNGGVSLVTFSPESRDLLHWIWIPEQFDEPLKAHLPYFDNIMFHDCDEARQKGLKLVAKVYSGEDKRSYFKHIFNHSGFSAATEDLKAWVMAQKYFGFSFAIQQHSGIFLNDYTGKYFSNETNDILIRFSKVFEQSYIRFLDLQKAEAQARESQIQLALERVRARTMAMQKSDELSETAVLLFHQLMSLELNVKGCGFNIWEKEEKTCTSWMSGPDGELSPPFNLPLTKDPLFIRYYESRQKGEDFWVYETGKEELANRYDHLRTLPVLGDAITKELETGKEIPSFVVDHVVNFSHGNLIFITYERCPGAWDIFKRFGKVFEQTYTRFLDLQKAEAQARQAKIEAAMEKVRSGAMAMQKPNELVGVAELLRKEMGLLGVEELETSSIYIHHEDSGKTECWYAIQKDNKLVSDYMSIDLNDTRVGREMLAFYGSGKKQTSIVMQGEARKEWINYCAANSSELVGFYGDNIPDRTYHLYKFTNGYMGAASPGDISAESWDLLQRATSVFSLAYTRFSDLQQAEAQARESQIEASLERVRSKAMSMQKSEDLANAVATVFEELDKLDIGVLRVGISVLNKEKRCGNVWLTSIDEGKAVQVSGDEPFDIHPLLHGAFEAWLRQEDFYYVLEGDDLIHYYEAVEAAQFRLPASQMLLTTAGPKQQHCFVAVYNSGGLFAFRDTIFPEEAKAVMRRFAAVFDLTYKRFLDLQKAEAQAKEAKIEVALERVRSRTLAMQKSDELAETAAVLFQQLIALGIEPNRLYISIIKSELGETEFWITDEDGSKVSTAFAANMNDNSIFVKMYEGWKQQQKSLVIDMQGEELENYFRHLTSLGVPFKEGLSQKRRVQDIAYFSKGFIGMASPDEQPGETLVLLERFAAVFNLTFTRFNDLKIAEAHAQQAEQDLIAIKEAKQKAEEALTELQATQKQLIQSEKMASLGELTAGIAHEIQNPLNFVNNFSEVSKELLDEMREAIEKGDTEEAKEIMNDVIQNLEKINHHGKRADGIVKGMLQHSRSSSATKEPTDINALCDEYLRLSYHGLRAKDKSFNATMKTDFDKSIGNINIISQEIGRVILNLITNAFYAVNEKQTLRQVQGDTSYEPSVVLSTKRIDGKVQISVKDNGMGIPDTIKEKIFQPFFTTKPTGKGTGLGLSLSYDIIKAHGGEIKVNTKEREGSEFIIQLRTN